MQVTKLSDFTRTAKLTTKKERIVTERETESIEVDVDFTQVYHCFSLLSFRITSATSFQLLFFLLQNTGRDNIVIINKNLMERFFSLYILVSGKAPVSKQSFYNSINDLLRAEVLKKLAKGSYFLNPYTVWKGDKDKRCAYLKEDSGKGQTFAFNPIQLLEAPEPDRIIQEHTTIEPYE